MSIKRVVDLDVEEREGEEVISEHQAKICDDKSEKKPLDPQLTYTKLMKMVQKGGEADIHEQIKNEKEDGDIQENINEVSAKGDFSPTHTKELSPGRKKTKTIHRKTSQINTRSSSAIH